MEAEPEPAALEPLPAEPVASAPADQCMQRPPGAEGELSAEQQQAQQAQQHDLPPGAEAAAAPQLLPPTPGPAAPLTVPSPASQPAALLPTPGPATLPSQKPPHLHPSPSHAASLPGGLPGGRSSPFTRSPSPELPPGFGGAATTTIWEEFDFEAGPLLPPLRVRVPAGAGTGNGNGNGTARSCSRGSQLPGCHRSATGSPATRSPPPDPASAFCEGGEGGSARHASGAHGSCAAADARSSLQMQGPLPGRPSELHNYYGLNPAVAAPAGAGACMHSSMPLPTAPATGTAGAAATSLGAHTAVAGGGSLSDRFDRLRQVAANSQAPLAMLPQQQPLLPASAYYGLPGALPAQPMPTHHHLAFMPAAGGSWQQPHPSQLGAPVGWGSHHHQQQQQQQADISPAATASADTTPSPPPEPACQQPRQ